jgi:WD40 repeat protein
LPFQVNVVSWVPGSQWIAAGGIGDGSATSESLAVIDAASGAIRWSLPNDMMVSDVKVSPDGHWLAVAEYSANPAPPPDTLYRARVLSTDQGTERCPAITDHQADMVAFSPDSTCVAATILAYDDQDPQPVWVFDAATGAVRWTQPGYNIMSLAFSPDSRWVAAADANSVALVFDAATGTQRPQPGNIAVGGVWAVAFSPDGQSVAAGGGDNALHLFAADTGKQAWSTTVDPQNGPVGSVAFSADGQWIAALTPGTAGVFGADGSTRFAQPTQFSGSTVTFSPTLRHIAISSLIVMDAAKGTVYWQATVGQTTSPAGYSDDGRWIAVGFSDPTGAHAGLVNVYDMAVEQARREYSGPVTWVTTNTAGMRLAAAASAGQTSAGQTEQTATIFQADTGDLLLERVHPGVVTSIAFSPDSQFFATGSTDANARLYQTISGVPVWKIAHGGPVNAVTVSSDNGWVATASSDRFARVLSHDTGQLRCQYQHGGAVTAVVFSPDTQLLATGSADRSTRILSAVTGDQLHQFVHDGRVRAVTFSPSGALLATGNEDGTVLVIDTATGQQTGQIVHTSAVTAVAISPDGQLIATGGEDRAVRLSGLGGGAPGPARVLTYDAPVTALAFSPVDPLLAVVTENDLVRVIDPGTGAEAYRLIHPAAVHAIAFTGDGALIVTACDDKVARVFPARLP